MRQSRRDWIAVDLDEDRGLPSAAPGSLAAHALRQALTRLPLWLRIALLAGLCLAIAVPTMSWQRTERRAARLASTDNLAAELTLPVHDAWRSYGSYVGAPEHTDVILSFDGESRHLRALAPDSGQAVWTNTTITADAVCRLPIADPAAAGSHDRAELLLCTDGPRLDTLDVTDGAVVRTVVLPWTEVDALAIGTDVVATGLDSGGHLAAARWDASTGDEAWSYAGSATLGTDRPTVFLEPAVAEVLTPDTVVRLDMATGVELPDSGYVAARTLALPGGTTAVEEWDTSPPNAHTKRVRVLDPDGGERFAIEGYLVQPSIDDGATPDVLLVARQGAGGLRAVDARSGAELWSTDDAAQPHALIDRRLLVLSDEQLVALDARTGAELWRTRQTTTAAWQSLITDGNLVARVEVAGQSVVPEYSDSVRPGVEYQMVARRLDAGDVAWTAPWSMVSADALVVTPAGHVLAVGPAVVAGLQPAGT
jgi:outer membrane protein assembly factor BamB